jgi:hypothetical protein
MKDDKIKSVSIKFKPDFYGQFQNFNNKIWNVIGEYVDNAWQSFDQNRDGLKINAIKPQLIVEIIIDKENDIITIDDNAGGIDSVNIVRALEVANTHSDTSGLNEFGMGLKTSSNWLSKSWSIRTTAIGEPVERMVKFDLDTVKKMKLEELPITSTEASKNSHYTKITLRELTKNAPSNHQIDKIKKHLTSIYRKFLSSGDLRLIINKQELSYEEPEVLFAPHYSNISGKPILWKKEINFTAGKFKAIGFIGVLSTMSTSENNGLSLFRRGRVIEGSYDEKYRPKVLCGQVGSPRYKRIFGELELEGFSVSFNKGSFQEQEDLLSLMEALQSEINSKDFDLYNQAERYIKPKSQENNSVIAKNIVSNLKSSNPQNNFKNNVKNSIKQIANKKLKTDNELILKKAKVIEFHEDIIEIENEKITLKLELITEPSVQVLYSLENTNVDNVKLYKINLAHAFFTRFDQFKKEEDYQPIISIIRSLVLAEIQAPSQGTKNGGNIRYNFNMFLKNI